MCRRESESIGKIAPSANRFQATGNAENNAGNARAPAVSGQPDLHTSFNHGGTVGADIKNEDDQTNNAQSEYGSRGFSRALQNWGNLIRVERFLNRGDEKPRTKNDHREEDVNEAFEGVNAEGIRQGNLLFARNEQRADRFADASEEEDGGKTGYGHAEDGQEPRTANIFLEIPPTNRAEKIANIDEKDSGEKVERLGTLDGVPEGPGAEATVRKQMAKVVQEVPE
jgi:hypothetical protein